MRVFVALGFLLCVACEPMGDPYAGNDVGYRGVLSTDGRDLGQHQLEKNAVFGSTANGYVGTCGRTDDHKSLTLDVAFDSWHRGGQFVIDRTPNAEGVDIDLAWSHHFIPRSDCSRFEIGDNPPSLLAPISGPVKLTCTQAGKNGDTLTIDVEVRGC
ncbi:MAG: hypothetical protein ABI183_10040 [Polyangiaceae bacterium]